jgi:hypothetical protein
MCVLLEEAEEEDRQIAMEQVILAALEEEEEVIASGGFWRLLSAPRRLSLSERLGLLGLWKVGTAGMEGIVALELCWSGMAALVGQDRAALQF